MTLECKHVTSYFLPLKIDCGPSSCSNFEDQLDPEIDEEMLREYEEFVQEFEDHLLMQEFGIGESNQGAWQ